MSLQDTTPIIHGRAWSPNLIRAGDQVVLVWVRGHSGVIGNGTTDLIARNVPPVETYKPHFTSFYPLIESTYHKELHVEMKKWRQTQGDLAYYS